MERIVVLVISSGAAACLGPPERAPVSSLERRDEAASLAASEVVASICRDPALPAPRAATT